MYCAVIVLNVQYKNADPFGSDYTAYDIDLCIIFGVEGCLLSVYIEVGIHGLSGTWVLKCVPH